MSLRVGSLAWVLSVVVLGVLGFMVAPALAARGHVFEGSFGSEGEGAGEFKEPDGVAVEEVWGSVFESSRWALCAVALPICLEGCCRFERREGLWDIKQVGSVRCGAADLRRDWEWRDLCNCATGRRGGWSLRGQSYLCNCPSRRRCRAPLAEGL